MKTPSPGRAGRSGGGCAERETTQVDAAQPGRVGVDGMFGDGAIAASPAHRRFDHDDLLPQWVDADRFKLLLVAGHTLVGSHDQIDAAAAQHRRRSHVDR